MAIEIAGLADIVRIHVGGEIVVSSPQVMGSYWKLPEATQRAIQGEWFFTGGRGLPRRQGLSLHP